MCVLLRGDITHSYNFSIGYRSRRLRERGKTDLWSINISPEVSDVSPSRCGCIDVGLHSVRSPSDLTLGAEWLVVKIAVTLSIY